MEVGRRKRGEGVVGGEGELYRRQNKLGGRVGESVRAGTLSEAVHVAFARVCDVIVTMASDVSVTNKAKQVIRKCTLDDNSCVSLLDVLNSFNAPINEEHAWALCFQCAVCFKSVVEKEKDKCMLVDSVDQVFVSKEGTVHPKTVLGTPQNAGMSLEDNCHGLVTRWREGYEGSITCQLTSLGQLFPPFGLELGYTCVSV